MPIFGMWRTFVNSLMAASLRHITHSGTQCSLLAVSVCRPNHILAKEKMETVEWSLREGDEEKKMRKEAAVCVFSDKARVTAPDNP